VLGAGSKVLGAGSNYLNQKPSRIHHSKNQT